jgi:hypothetical protein
MFLLKQVETIEAALQKAGRGVSMKMLLSPDESPSFAMRNFIIDAGGTGSVIGPANDTFDIVDSVTYTVTELFHGTSVQHNHCYHTCQNQTDHCFSYILKTSKL